MSRPVATKLIVEFEDGLRVEKDFADLPQPLQDELLRQPAAARPSSSPQEDRFLLLEWEDGWKEVLRVGPGSSEPHRYYVITRPEEVGRLSLKTGGDYPELVEIRRRPHALCRLSLAGSYRLEAGREEREGSKTDRHYDLQPQAEVFSELQAGVKRLVEQGELALENLSSSDHSARLSAYRSVSRELGVRPARDLQDVLDFVSHLLETGERGSEAADSTHRGGTT